MSAAPETAAATGKESASASSQVEPPPWESPQWQETVSQNPGLAPFFDNLESFVELPKGEGIEKLRQMILDLAIRGSLNCGSTDDEPASKLVESLKNEQVERQEGRKAKRKLPTIDAADPPFAIPKNWTWVRLGEIGDTNIGLTYKPGDKSKDGMPVLRSSNVQGGKIDLNDLVRVSVKPSEKVLVAEGDLLICARNGSKRLVGKTAVIQGLSEPMAFGAFMAIFRCRINPYLYHFITSPVFRRVISDVNTTTINQITQNNLRTTLVPLPPLSEQRRIVSKVEGLMSLCDTLESHRRARISVRERASRSVLASLTSAPRRASSSGEPQVASRGYQVSGEETLKSAWHRLSDHFEVLLDQPSSVDSLRQSILQLAVQGKLVPQDPSDEPASDLLAKLRTRREQLIANGELKKSKIVALTDDDIDPTAAPHWKWACLNELVEVMNSGWSPACEPNPTKNESEWGVLKTTSVQSFVFWEHEHKRLPDHLEPRPEAEAKSGDLLITRAGPKNRVGVSCLVRDVRPRLMISDKVIRFHLIEPYMYDEFVALCLNGGISQEHIEKSKSGMAASQMNISQAKFRMTPIPIPPHAEQKRIVSKVSLLLSQCNELSTKMRSRQSTTDALLTALIHQILADV